MRAVRSDALSLRRRPAAARLDEVSMLLSRQGRDALGVAVGSRNPRHQFWIERRSRPAILVSADTWGEQPLRRERGLYCCDGPAAGATAVMVEIV